MKECFVQKNFSPASAQMIATAGQICEEYAAQGYDLSLRQLYYQFVARNLLANTEQNYKRLGCIISDARLAGQIDWDHIKDRTRETVSNGHWSSPKEILDSAARSFCMDLWENQPNHVEVMVEKQALEGVLIPVCKRLDVPFTANRGYSSSSSFYEVGQRLDRQSDRGKRLHVLYLGDHDPSGIDMTRDVQDRLELLGCCCINIHRLALNIDQVHRYQPPKNPAKLTDSRAIGYIAQFGRSSWELDALNPEILAGLVESAILDLRDEKLWQAAVRRQAVYRAELERMAESYQE